MTQEQCDNVPNASWDETAQVCVCCATDGNSYASNGVCMMCPLDSKCGDNSYCKGSPAGQCIQDENTLKWKVGECTSCQGTCDGDCGIGEWFAFQDCVGTDDKRCEFTISQWKSWLTYGLLIVFFILFVFITYRLLRKKKVEPVPVPKKVRRKNPCEPDLYNRISGYFPARPKEKEQELITMPYVFELDKSRAFSPVE